MHCGERKYDSRNFASHLSGFNSRSIQDMPHHRNNQTPALLVTIHNLFSPSSSPAQSREKSTCLRIARRDDDPIDFPPVWFVTSLSQSVTFVVHRPCPRDPRAQVVVLSFFIVGGPGTNVLRSTHDLNPYVHPAPLFSSRPVPTTLFWFRSLIR